MGEVSKIEWTDSTFNPWVGCTKLSPACDHCYAEGWAKRTGQSLLWSGNRRRTSASNWRQPIKWNRQAATEGTRKRVFCASLADVFDNQIPERWRDDLWHLIDQTPHLDWLLLTKRPQNIAKMLPNTATGVKAWADGWPNVWLGTTAEDALHYRQRWAHVAAVPASIRFLSFEPALGTIGDLDLGRVGAPDWVICGGESGHGARPMLPDWAREARDQCDASNVPFFFKQWGEFKALSDIDSEWWNAASSIQRDNQQFIEGHAMIRVSKCIAGRLLDGRTHNDSPPAPKV